MTAKKCAITGHAVQNSGDHWAWDYVTIDRVDRARGYEKGNCIAVASKVNEIKGLVEDPNNSLTPNDLIKIAKYMIKSARKEK